MLHGLLNPTKHLLKIKHGSVAAIGLATNYIEAIEIYASGKDSKANSKKFFCRGFNRIFAAVVGPPFMQEAIAAALYSSLRCGFVHEANFGHSIYLSEVRKEAFTVTWPRKNGEFDPNGHLQSAVINPTGFIRCIEIHFKDYVRQLRAKESTNKVNFLAAIELKWRLGPEGPLIAMTEEQFFTRT
jgi:hypothetical protein